jgi:hypothetical protein
MLNGAVPVIHEGNFGFAWPTSTGVYKDTRLQTKAKVCYFGLYYYNISVFDLVYSVYINNLRHVLLKKF